MDTQELNVTSTVSRLRKPIPDIRDIEVGQGFYVYTLAQRGYEYLKARKYGIKISVRQMNGIWFVKKLSGPQRPSPVVSVVEGPAKCIPLNAKRRATLVRVLEELNCEPLGRAEYYDLPEYLLKELAQGIHTSHGAALYDTLKALVASYGDDYRNILARAITETLENGYATFSIEEEAHWQRLNPHCVGNMVVVERFPRSLTDAVKSRIKVEFGVDEVYFSVPL